MSGIISTGGHCTHSGVGGSVWDFQNRCIQSRLKFSFKTFHMKMISAQQEPTMLLCSLENLFCTFLKISVDAIRRCSLCSNIAIFLLGYFSNKKKCISIIYSWKEEEYCFSNQLHSIEWFTIHEQFSDLCDLTLPSDDKNNKLFSQFVCM